MPIRRAASVAVAFTTVVPFIASSCVPPPPRHLEDLGRVMDDMARKEGEFGTMSISSPLLASPTNVFEFKVNRNSQDFYDDAKHSVQGRVAEFEQTVNSFGFGANVSIDPSLAAAYLAQLQQYQQAVTRNLRAESALDQQQSLINAAAVNTYNQALAAAQKEPDPAKRAQMVSDAINNLKAQMIAPGPTTLPSFPTSAGPTTAPTDLVSPPTAQTAQFAAAGDAGKVFAGFQRLAATQPALSIPDRTALVTAAGDTAVNAMFQVLGNPNLGERFRGKRILFGVSTVSVNPGWRTKKGYAADVAMITSYDWQPARTTLAERFIRNTRVPARLRVRIALDQELPLPVDAAAIDLIKLAAPHVSDDMTAGRVNPSSPPVLTDAEVRSLQDLVANAPIPAPYRYEEPAEAGGRAFPLVAAVSPMTETQTLDLASSSRREREVALQLALQLQLIGAKVLSQAFENYANNLQQDVATLTPAVVANSYSSGGIFGFQIGPRLRAVEQAKKQQFSGPAEILERQSFPCLIVFGFGADDLTPRVREEDGSYRLYEREVRLTSVHNWVPVNDPWYGESDAKLTETDRLRYSFWLRRYSDRAGSSGLPAATLKLAEVRANMLKYRLFGAAQEFTIPEEVVSPPGRPVVTRIEPERIEVAADADKDVPILLAGDDLQGADLSQIRAVSGGRVLGGSDGPRFVGNAIALKVHIHGSNHPDPLVFDVPSVFGDRSFTPPIRPVTSGVPSVAAVAPSFISSDSDATGKPQPGEVTVVLAGERLDLISVEGIKAVPEGGPCAVLQDPNAKPRRRGANAIELRLAVKGPAGALALLLPRADGRGAIYSPPITVVSNKYVIERTQDKEGKQTRDHVDFSRGTPEATVNAVVTGSTTKPSADAKKDEKPAAGTAAGQTVGFEINFSVKVTGGPATKPSK